MCSVMTDSFSNTIIGVDVFGLIRNRKIAIVG
jgi:hypothetical protein